MELGALKVFDFNLGVTRRFHLIRLREPKPRPVVKAMAEVIVALAATRAGQEAATGKAQD
jgi:hypothetical protein